jgi:hypothetical protein
LSWVERRAAVADRGEMVDHALERAPERRRGDGVPEVAERGAALAGRVAGDEGGVDRTDRGAGDPARRDLLLGQCLEGTRLVGTERAAALQHERDAVIVSRDLSSAPLRHGMSPPRAVQRRPHPMIRTSLGRRQSRSGDASGSRDEAGDRFLHAHARGDARLGGKTIRVADDAGRPARPPVADAGARGSHRRRRDAAPLQRRQA